MHTDTNGLHKPFLTLASLHGLLHLRDWCRVLLWLLTWMTMLTAGLSMAQMAYELVQVISGDSALTRAMWHGIFAVACLGLFVVFHLLKSHLGPSHEPIFRNATLHNAASAVAGYTGMPMSTTAASLDEPPPSVTVAVPRQQTRGAADHFESAPLLPASPPPPAAAANTTGWRQAFRPRAS